MERYNKKPLESPQGVPKATRVDSDLRQKRNKVIHNKQAARTKVIVDKKRSAIQDGFSTKTTFEKIEDNLKIINFDEDSPTEILEKIENYALNGVSTDEFMQLLTPRATKISSSCDDLLSELRRINTSLVRDVRQHLGLVDNFTFKVNMGMAYAYLNNLFLNTNTLKMLLSSADSFEVSLAILSSGDVPNEMRHLIQSLQSYSIVTRRLEEISNDFNSHVEGTVNFQFDFIEN